MITKKAYILCAILAFLGAFGGMVYWNLRVNGSLYLQSEGGDVYLSFVRNLLERAHFVQTIRTAGLVAPPGLPFVTAAVLFLTGNLSEFFVARGFADHAIGAAAADLGGVLAFQYAVFGSAAAFMAMTALRLAENGLREKPHKALPWTLAVLLGAATPVAYIWCSMRVGHPNPGYILTENYAACLIALLLWLVVSDAGIRSITVTAFVLMLFRPSCAPLFAAAFLWMVIRACRDRVGKNRPKVHARVHFYSIFVMIIVFSAVLGINAGVNWLETGHPVILESWRNLNFALVEPNFLQSGAVLGAVWYVFWVCFVIQLFAQGMHPSRKVLLTMMTGFLCTVAPLGALTASWYAPMVPLFVTVIVGTVCRIVCSLVSKPGKE